MLLPPQKLALGTMKSPQLSHPCQKRSIHVTACLRCAAQQLQQIVRLPTAVKPCQQQVTLQTDAISTLQRPLPQQMQDWQQHLQRPAQQQLTLAAAGCGPILPSQYHFSSSSSGSSAGSGTHSAQGMPSGTNQKRRTSRRGRVAAAGGDADGGAAAEQHISRVGAISDSPPSSSTAGCLPPMQQQPMQHNTTGHNSDPQLSQGPGPASPSSIPAPGDQPHTQLQQQQSELASSSQNQQRQQQQSPTDGEVDSPGVRAALAALKWYKGFLSPTMAATCRFQPTCSQYSMDSYRKYGVAKGTVLTAWRLLRCNPWGGSGYDPTSWPPIGLAPLFTLPYSAEVAVVVGTAFVLRFTHALLFE